jgi:Tfp pilus assembly protein PilF
MRQVTLALVLAGVAPAVQAQRVLVAEKLELLEERALRDSNDAAAHYNVAMGYLSKRRYDDAERELRQAVGLESNFADGYLALSIVHSADEAYWKRLKKTSGDDGVKSARDEFDRLYRRAFLIDPLVDLRILGAAFKLYGLGRMRYAIEDLVEGEYDKAYKALDKELRFFQGPSPHDASSEALRWLRGLAAAHAKRYDAAIADFDTLVARASRDTLQDSLSTIPFKANDYRYMLAALYHRTGDTGRALDLYRSVLEHDLGVYMAHVQMANIYEARRQYSEAVEERQRAVDTNPGDASLLTDLGVTSGKARRFAEAEAALQQALEANPRDARVPFWMGLCQAEQGKRVEAKASFTRFLAMAPSRWEKQIGMAKQRLEALQ